MRLHHVLSTTFAHTFDTYKSKKPILDKMTMDEPELRKLLAPPEDDMWVDPKVVEDARALRRAYLKSLGHLI